MAFLDIYQAVPDLDLALVNGASWSLSKQHGARYMLVAFYAGADDEDSRDRLVDLGRHVDMLGRRGVHVIAVSADDKERAVYAWRQWRLDGLPIGYGLSRQSAHAWGLEARQAFPGEPARLHRLPVHTEGDALQEEGDWQVEPAVFLIRSERQLAWSGQLSGGPGWPSVQELLEALESVEEESSEKSSEKSPSRTAPD
jgi:peroxiredoxin